MIEKSYRSQRLGYWGKDCNSRDLMIIFTSFEATKAVVDASVEFPFYLASPRNWNFHKVFGLRAE